MSFEKLQATLNASLICREEEVHCITLALIARDHCLFVGPPGTGKSALSSAIGVAIATNEFSVLLTKFSTPDDVFGPVSLTGLKADRYERVLTGRLAEAEIAFIDEVFKANSAILNAMLTAMQERKYDNGGKRVSIPLRTLIAASNEWPEEGELEALFDRFLIRRSVNPVPPSERGRLLFDDLPPVQPVMTLAEIDTAHVQAMALPIGLEAKQCYQEILHTLSKEKIIPGDRRMRSALRVARAEAFLAGAAEVERVHLEALRDVLWPRYSQIAATHDIVLKLANPAAGALQALMAEATELFGLDSKDESAQLSALKKLNDVTMRTNKLAVSDKRDKFLKSLKSGVLRLKAKHMGMTEQQAEDAFGKA